MSSLYHSIEARPLVEYAQSSYLSDVLQVNDNETEAVVQPITPEVIERAAHQMIKRYGKEAAKQAAVRSNSAMETGDEFNHELWLRVAMAVVALQFPKNEREIIYSNAPKDFTKAEVWAAARLMIEYFPDCASFLAAQRADGALDQGDVEGCNAWARISKAAQELERTKPRDGEALN